MKRIIMTGATGFIGSYLLKECINNGVEVTVLTSRSNFVKISSPLIKVVPILYDDLDQLYPQIEKGFDAFYHMGWAGVAGKEKNNIDLQISNIEESIQLLRLSKVLECNVFIAAGTVAEYVFSENVIDFSQKQTPNDVYGATKVATHYLLEAIAKQIQQELLWVVLPSTFGEGRKEDNILSYTIIKLLKGERPVYGNLEQMWDFLYVTEVARALYLIGEKGKHNTVYGIGSGIYRPLKEYICEIRDMINPNLPLGINEIAFKSKQTLSSCVNIKELTEDTGFIPQVSFEDGMKKTIRYYEEQLNGK